MLTWKDLPHDNVQEKNFDYKREVMQENKQLKNPNADTGKMYNMITTVALEQWNQLLHGHLKVSLPQQFKQLVHPLHSDASVDPSQIILPPLPGRCVGPVAVVVVRAEGA